MTLAIAIPSSDQPVLAVAECRHWPQWEDDLSVTCLLCSRTLQEAPQPKRMTLEALQQQEAAREPRQLALVVPERKPAAPKPPRVVVFRPPRPTPRDGELSTKAAALLVGVTPDMIRKAIQTGRLAGRKERGVVFALESDVRAWHADRQARAEEAQRQFSHPHVRVRPSRAKEHIAPEGLLSPAQVATMTGIGYSSVSMAAWRGQLPFVFENGRRWYRPEDVTAWRERVASVRADSMTSVGERRRVAVLDHLKAHGPCTAREIALALGLVSAYAAEMLRNLRHDGRVQVASGAGSKLDPWRWEVVE